MRGLSLPCDSVFLSLRAIEFYFSQMAPFRVTTLFHVQREKEDEKTQKKRRKGREEQRGNREEREDPFP